MAYLEIRVPGMQPGQQVGLGDAVKAVTGAFGIRQCEPCKRRQVKANKLVAFRGRRKRR